MTEKQRKKYIRMQIGLVIGATLVIGVVYLALFV